MGNSGTSGPTGRRMVRLARVPVLVVAAAGIGLAGCGDDGGGSLAGGGDVEAPGGPNGGERGQDELLDDLEDATDHAQRAAGADDPTELPEGFPDDIPLPEDAEIVETSEGQYHESSDGEQVFAVNIVVRIETGLAWQETVDFYEEQLPGAGWEITDTRPHTTDGIGFLAEKDGRELNIEVTGESNQAGEPTPVRLHHSPES